MLRLPRVRASNTAIILALAFVVIALTSLTPAHAAPKVGPVRPEESIVGGHAEDFIGSGGVYALPSGNIVILSPEWNNGRGAVTCLTPAEYRAGGIVVSAANSLVGERPGDQVGVYGITILSNGNFVITSYRLSTREYTITWANGISCLPHGEAMRGAMVSATNSLVGLRSSYIEVIALTNGNYVVSNPEWDNGNIPGVGAVTWANGTTGLAGTVSAENSLIGSSPGDSVGSVVVPLTNGNYVVGSGRWDNGAVVNAGAATWGNGATGIIGFVSAQNSLVGTSKDDEVGGYLLGGFITPLVALDNGNYVVATHKWDNGDIVNVGAVTWGDGTTGVTGTISAANSLIGLTANDVVGWRMAALSNGHYVVGAPGWDHDGIADVGAATWVDGMTGLTGTISPTNSLIGSSPNDGVGSRILRLTNGNYVVSTNVWDNGLVIDAGAATWGNGDGGTTGIVSAANSVVGSQSYDQVDVVLALTNGHYLVGSPLWDHDEVVDAGAVTWANGLGGTVGALNSDNALVGTQSDDQVGLYSVALSNGNYVLKSPYWSDGLKAAVGAVTWGNGSGSTAGPVSVTNSLIGANANEMIGLPLGFNEIGSFNELANGHYVIYSYTIGAVTWANGTMPTTGVVNASNSTLGSHTLSVFPDLVVPLQNGDYLISFPYWDRGDIDSAGAMVWMDGSGGTFDASTISEANALVGTKPNENLGGTWERKNHTITLPDGTYIINVPTADNGPLESAGAVFWSDASLPGQNTSPTLAPIGDLTAQVGELLSVDAEAIDPDQPAESLTFSIAGAPPEAAFNPATGVLTWTPAEADAGQTFNVTVTVADDGAPQGVDSETFAITVTDGDGNTPPTLATIGPRIGYAGRTLRFTASATDPDQPAQALTFSLGGDAPAGATLDPLTGQFAWPISADQTPGVVTVTITVTDDGAPAESASETFAVRVEAANRVGNYGFEAKGKTEAKAGGWVAVGLTKNDRRVCNTPNKTLAHEGRCAYRFQYSGAKKPARTLGRALNINGFVKGDVLELRGVIRANNLAAGARVTLRVVYRNNQTKVVNVKVAPGTYDYAAFSETLTLARAVKAASVQLRLGATKGTIFIDDLAVIHNPAATLLVDDGAAGAGLRGVD